MSAAIESHTLQSFRREKVPQKAVIIPFWIINMEKYVISKVNSQFSDRVRSKNSRGKVRSELLFSLFTSGNHKKRD